MSYRTSLRARVSPALFAATEPGDQVVADMLAQTGPTMAIDLALSLIVVAGGLAESAVLIWRLVHGYGGTDPLGGALIFAGLLGAALALRRKQVFLVVTRRQFICFGLGRSGTASRLMFAVPIQSGSITRTRWSVRYTGPDGKTIRFNTNPLARRWRGDVGEVVAALEAGGPTIEPAR
jgi:hypothetical protein